MAYDSLKNIIRQYIKTNGEQEITGQIMQNVLIEMVNNYPSTEGYIRATLSNLANGDILVYDSVGAWYNTPMSSFLAGYATQLWVNQQGYVTSSALAGYIHPTITDLANGDILIWDSVGAWVNTPLDTTISGFGYVKSTGSVAYATSAGSANILGHSVYENPAHALANGDMLVYDSGTGWTNVETSSILSGYATQSWVTSQGYITASALNGYATQSWVTSQGYIQPTLSNLANGDVLIYDSVGSWVNTNLNTTISGFGYITSSALSGYATETWVTNQGYITSSALNGYATQSWVNQQGFLTSSALNGYIHPTLSNLSNGDILIWDSVGAWVNAPLDTTISGFGYVKNTGSVAYATSAANSDTVDGYHVSAAVRGLNGNLLFKNQKDILVPTGGGYVAVAKHCDAPFMFGYYINTDNIPSGAVVSVNCFSWTSYKQINVFRNTGYSNNLVSDIVVSNVNSDGTYNVYLKVNNTYAARLTIVSEVVISGDIENTVTVSTSLNLVGNWGFASNCGFNGNAKSATQLRTARTIWGQSFDGTGNVSGAMFGVTEMRTSNTAQYVRCLEEGLGITDANFTSTFIISNWGTWIEIKHNNGLPICINGSSNVGIGTQSPAYNLDVNGSANATTLYENGSRVITTANIGSQSVNHATSAGSANILGQTVSENTAHSLSNGDTLVYDAGIAWVNVASGLSDIRQKSVINYEAEPMFEAVANAPAIRFTWKDATYSFRRGIHVGSIAQYWQTTLPEAVTMDNEGMLSMQYDVIALLSTISVAKKVSEHERRIVILERENEELRKELAALKSA